VYVESGGDLLSEAEEAEEDILDKAFDVRMNSRLGCQAKIEREGEITVRISKESLDTYYNEHPEQRERTAATK
jgi:2Fe-2S ferredoxin